MTFNPELGSTSPAVLLDNAQRLDKLVNGPALTEPDRAGDDLDTWRGMMAKSNAAIDDAQNSITILGLPFATLADAQAAVDAGKIPDGAITWIRNDDASLADEYINNGGILSATGRKMPSQEYIDDGFTPGRVVESDTDVAIALTFAEGSRSWLESDYDGGPTEHSAKLIGKAINIGDSPDSDKNVAIALTFAEGSRSWLESDYDGGPTEYAAEKIAEAINWSPPASESQTVPLSTAPDGTAREYPTFKRLSAPIIQFSQQSAPTVYWPWIVNKSAWGGTGFALFYSTDHSATHDPSGIFLFEADDITGPWVNRGKIYRDDAGGWQTETPSVIYDPVSNKVLMYYQQAGVPGAIGQQQTCLATADPADLTAWTRVGVVLDKEFLEQPGDGHCGYFRPFSYNGQLFGYSLYGGTNYSNAALWTSDDGGYTWQRDGRLIGWMQDKCRHLAVALNAEPQDVLLTMYEGDVLNWRGKPWWVGVSGKAQSGSVLIRHFRLVTAPLADDFASLTVRVKDITPPPATYEVQGDIDYPGNCVTAGGVVYMAYRTGGQKGDISLMRLN
ncbi:hypothetical protein M1V81_18515 [Klebsiella pneumoniae]|uniref:hypothetical protein n=1 Tax=Klebsiella pneumoniae TaxID=573 RepID=UPI000E2CBB8B|nr:hypothetical protein [Klebsiella pneumoniae]EKY4131955.1 hypothetical protein [Klebsiella quasipneumoniae]QBP07746.1 flagellar biosynthesis protein [Klebsiella phage ST846-OXA48phi9.2]EIY2249524.1 hypothetical protein [Klebsiella pneumoniae]EKT9687423.1 hypothetical protein [Klebsiella pneumoniae]EKW0027974.1 hypothetical protein [Klebsiella pneumoniae]